ncbi:muconolactone delta-isomerase [Streptomyces hygroscopicus]|uniref:muconolactone Delta-isomerase n=1 Tax=Streptomyces hygroscopicus TaxID=1912 RepID=UPI002240A98C|nr:muconolactone Delta-isomerase family protein [Streptomyces hygroscopicus]MCW7945208.1 muconolactone delta-isomerase [Streptomyces hygroscopicus]
MLFAVRTDVEIPRDLAPEVRTDLLAREKAYCQELQKSGEWVHIWRRVGHYANISVFDVADNEALHRILWNLPLFPYMRVQATPLAQHPSDLAAAAEDVA